MFWGDIYPADLEEGVPDWKKSNKWVDLSTIAIDLDSANGQKWANEFLALQLSPKEVWNMMSKIQKTNAQKRVK